MRASILFFLYPWCRGGEVTSPTPADSEIEESDYFPISLNKLSEAADGSTMTIYMSCPRTKA